MSQLGLLATSPPGLEAPRGVVDAWASELAGGVVAGVDEAGRGPLAGPVVAAAAVLPADWARCPLLRQVDDSKRLGPGDRARLARALPAILRAYGVGRASATEIDQTDILQATFLAMRRALAQCARRLRAVPGIVLVDGRHAVRDLAGLGAGWAAAWQVPLVSGDARSVAIGAASVLAKVVRDRHLEALDLRHPGYGLADHKGYPTPAHRAALALLGPSPVHRRTFRGVA